MPQAGTIDQQLLMNQAEEQQAVAELRQRRQKEEEESVVKNNVSQKEKNIIIESAEALGTVVFVGDREEAIRQGIFIGIKLRENISNCKFDGGTFYTVLILSAIKDILDVPGMVTLGLSGTLINIAIGFILFIVFFLRRSRIKGYIVKKIFARLWRYLIMIVIAETTPIINFAPNYLVMTFLLKRKVDRKREEMKMQLTKLEKGIEDLKNTI